MRFASIRTKDALVVRSLFMIPLALLLVAAAGVGICKALHFPIPTSTILLAGGICLISDEIALIPLILARKGNQLAVSQAGLFGTIIQLLVSITAAGAVLMRFPNVSGTFVYWLFAFYFVSLIVLVVTFVIAVNKAPMGTQAPGS